MYFADLTPFSYNIPELQGFSIGWLDEAHGFPRGVVPSGFVERLAEICSRPVVQHRGFHVCEFCEFEPDPTFAVQKAAGALSSSVIRVVGRDGRVYHSPAMIRHYVEAHSYQPPPEFIEAVMKIEYAMWPNSLAANDDHTKSSFGSCGDVLTASVWPLGLWPP